MLDAAARYIDARKSGLLCGMIKVLLHFVTLMEKLADETKRLVRLQAVELERVRLTVALKALPGEIAAADGQLKAAQKRVADAEAALKREELARGALELDVASLRTKVKRFRAQLDGAQNASQAQAFEHQIGFAEAEITRLEDDELTSMENTEILETERIKARELAARLTETLGLIRARVAEQDLEYREQLAHLKTEREKLRVELAPWDDGARLAHFDRVAGSKGTGLARAENQQCGGCRMGIRPQVWNLLRGGSVLPCESCSRILYYDPAMTADPVPSKTARSVSPDVALGVTSVGRRQAGV